VTGQTKYTPITLTTDDLPSLQYLPFLTDKTVVDADGELEPVESFSGSWHPGAVVFASDEKVSCHPLPVDRHGSARYLILRRETPGIETRFYIGFEELDRFVIKEIHPTVLIPNNGTAHESRFYLHFSEQGEYYLDLSAMQTTPWRFWRTNLLTYWEWPKRDFYRDERTPDYDYSDYLAGGAPLVTFDTKALLRTEYLPLDDIWYRFRMRSYANDLPGVAFHVLPAWYRNHDLIVERTKTAGGDRFLLFRQDIQSDGDTLHRFAYRFHEEPLIELTPQRHDSLTKEQITTRFTIFERNIILIHEKRERGPYRHEQLYSLYPCWQTPEEYSSDDQIEYRSDNASNTWLAGSFDEYRFRGEEAEAVMHYLKWLAEHHKELYAVDMLPLEKGRYRVDLAAADHIVNVFRKGNLVSERYLNFWYGYFNEAQAWYADNPTDPEEGPPPFFDYDLFFGSQESSEMIDAIRGSRVIVTGIRRIAPGRSVVTVNTGYEDMTFALTFQEEKWRIDEKLNSVYFATDEPLAIFMAEDDRQIDRMLEHYGMEAEDRDYYELIENTIAECQSNGVAVDLITPSRYHGVRFADGTEFDTHDFYYYDMMLYRPGQTPIVIRNIDREASRQEIGAYFRVDDERFDPSILHMEVTL
jgi:hypothetical protein